jgi:hypothetical protein
VDRGLYEASSQTDYAAGFNKVVLHTILHVSENIADENNITDSRIFNMGETSHTVLQTSIRFGAILS